MDKNTTPSQEIYDDLYFDQSCGGYEEFNISRGDILPPWMAYSLEKAQLKPSDIVLDIGAGRGEIAYQSAKASKLSIGLDYSVSALRFAKILRNKSRQINKPFDLILADGRNLPFASKQFSIVFMCDIVEHLSKYDLEVILKRIHQCLLPNGRLIIHTMPNMNYYRFGYPIFRVLNFLIGKILPKDPRERFYRGESHINIQTPKSLRLYLESVGFINSQIELKQLSGNRFKRFLCQLPLIRHILSNDIVAIGMKEDVNEL